MKVCFTSFNNFRFKDFASEVRGNMDVESLLDDAAVLLDLTETSLERIIHTILNKTLEILDAPMAYEEAMSTLFLPESGNILAKTIQVVSRLGHFWNTEYCQAQVIL